MSRRAKGRPVTGVRRREWRSGAVSWEARWYDASGKRHTANFDSAAEADAYRQENLRSRRLGGTGDPTGGRMTLGVWWAKWMSGRQISDSTRARDESCARTHILPAFGVRKLADIRPSDLAKWVADMTRIPLEPATVTRNLVVLKGCLTEAVDEGLLQLNPAANVKPPRVRRPEQRFLSLDELARIEANMDPHWALVVPFTAATGLRIGEVAALRVRDLNIPAGQVRVRATVVGVTKEVSGAARRLQTHPTKTYAGERVVPTVTRSLGERLAAMIAARSLRPDDLLFTGRQSAPMAPDNWRSRVWKPAVLAADLADPQPPTHALRHTAVTLWIATGKTNRLELARWTGHGTAQFTESTYSHLLDDGALEAREALECLMQSGSPTGGTITPIRQPEAEIG